MPPLPSTAQTLTNRLDTLSESNKATLQLIQRLSKLDFQPGSTPLNSEEGDARLELSAEIHESLKQLEEELELLRQEAEDVVQSSASTTRRRDSARDNERLRLEVLLARLTEDLNSSRTQFRKAQLAAKRNADRAKLKERELLFSTLQSGSSTPTSGQRRRQGTSNLAENEVITAASSDVTAALRRTQQLMQSELSRSTFAQETLEQSTAALADLGETYTDLSSLLSKSRNLVTTLLKSTKSDTWYLETTLYILLTTVIWLIFRRWLYGPITWFIIWPIKLLFRVTFALIPAASLAAGSATSSVATTASFRTTTPSTSLIIKPSATDKPPKFERPAGANPEPAYVRVGGGGRGNPYQYYPDPSPPGSYYSQKIGKMAEENQQQGKEQEQELEQEQLREQRQGGEERKERVVRGDGTVLKDRPVGKKVNPMKKMWEEDGEREKFERERGERAGGEQGGSRTGGVGKRDEL